MDPIEASRLIMDTYAAKILVACARKPKHALELSRRLGIPIAATYRRIHVLAKAGLLKEVEKALTQQGKRIALYQSLLRNAYIFFENGRLRVRFQMVTGQVEDFGGEWKEIKILQEEEELAGPRGGFFRPKAGSTEPSAKPSQAPSGDDQDAQ